MGNVPVKSTRRRTFLRPSVADQPEFQPVRAKQPDNSNTSTTPEAKKKMDAEMLAELERLRSENQSMKQVIAKMNGDDTKAESSATEETNLSAELKNKALTVVVVGASGHLARTKTFPALFALFAQNYLPSNVRIIGYARSQMSDKEFHDQVSAKLKAGDKLNDFISRCSYFAGDYGSEADFHRLDSHLREIEAANGGANGTNRVFYFAIPPSVFGPAAAAIKKGCSNVDGFIRIIVEKPFGKDLESSEVLARELLASFTENQLYRIDHYLGKEMVQNLMVLRFSNLIFDSSWNRHYISSVMITFKENVGVEGRGGYFDGYGILRDVMQNHLMQILSLVAMEQPASLNAEDIRDEKVKVLRAISPVSLDDMVIGQYDQEPNGKNPAYVDEPTVPKDSTTPTFAMAVLYIRNPRWDGVPFILKCGKGLNERKAEVRIQYHNFPGSVFLRDEAHSGNDDLPPNELVMRVQPDEAIYLKMMAKSPGLSEAMEQVELDLSYTHRFSINRLPDAYERLILDVVRGDHRLFVRNDELQQAWRIFTPVLHTLEQQKIKPIRYPFGSRGPEEANVKAQQVGVKHSTGYVWREPYQKK